VHVSEVNADRRRLVEDERRARTARCFVDEDRDESVRIEREIRLRLVRGRARSTNSSANGAPISSSTTWAMRLALPGW